MRVRLLGLLLPFGLVLLSGCQVQLYDGLEERQANEILAALLENRIKAGKAAGEEGTWKVLVEENQFARGMRILESRGLPRPKFDTFGDVFKKSGILSSPTEERARYLYALSQELSRTVCEMDGVLTARVHVVLPQESELGEHVTPGAVSVFVKYSDAFPFDEPSRTADIRKLVESSVQGLARERIQVVMCASSSKADALPEEPAGNEVKIAGFQLDRGLLPFAGAGAGLVGLLAVVWVVLVRRRGAPKPAAGGAR